MREKKERERKREKISVRKIFLLALKKFGRIRVKYNTYIKTFYSNEKILDYIKEVLNEKIYF